MSFSDPASDAAATSSDTTRGFVLGPDEGEAFWWLGSLSINKLTSGPTRGGLDIVDHRIPAGYAPPAHVHTISDEVFYIIDGEFAVRCGDEHWQAGPGSLVFLPRAVPHGFTLSEAGPGRTLLFNAPSGFTEVIRELGQPAPALVLPGGDAVMPDPARIGEISHKYGIAQV